jgi:hypothetical protein
VKLPKKWQVVIAVAAIVIVAAGACMLALPREPRYGGKPLSYWVDHLPYERVYAGSPWYTKQLKEARTRNDPTWVIRGNAFAAVSAIGSNGFPYLVTRLQDQDKPIELWLRRLVVMVATRIGFAPSRFQNSARLRREQVLVAFAWLGRDGRVAGPELLGVATNLTNDAEVRGAAWNALREVAPELVADFANPEYLLRESVALSLKLPNAAALDSDSIANRVKLLELLAYQGAHVRLWAAHKLWQVQPECAEKIMPILRDLHTNQAYFTCRFFGEIGPQAKEAVPLLLSTLQDPSPNVATNAAWALGRIGPEARSALPVLMDRMKTAKAIDVRVKSAEALGLIARGDQTAEAALREATQDQSEAVRKAAADALKQMKSVQ